MVWSMKNALKQKAAPLVVGTVLAVLIAEALLQVMFPRVEMDCPCFQPNPYFGGAYIPGARGWAARFPEFAVPIQINSRGLRDSEFPYEKPASTYRVLVLGDSFTAALNVPLQNTFHKVLMNRLNENGGASKRRFEVISAGYNGFGTDLELLFFRHEGFKYKPDLVVLAFFGNDLTDVSASYKPYFTPADGFPYFALRDGKLDLRNFPGRIDARPGANATSEGQAGFADTVRRFLREKIRTVRLLWDFASQVKSSLMGREESGDSTGPLDKQPQYITHLASYPPDMEDAQALWKALALQLRDEVRAAGAELVVMDIPWRESVEPRYWEALMRARPDAKAMSWDLDRPDNFVDTFLTQEGIPHLTLLPYLRAYARQGRELYYRGDGHLNVEGHRVTGELLFEWLAYRRLVPVDTPGKQP